MMLNSWSKMNISWIMLSLPLSFCFDHHHSCSPRSHPLSPLHWPHSPLPHAHNFIPFFSINFFFLKTPLPHIRLGGLSPWWCGWVIWITIHMSNPKDCLPWPMANPSRHQCLMFPNPNLKFTSPHSQIYRTKSPLHNIHHETHHLFLFYK